jgi:hypothetical protein
VAEGVLECGTVAPKAVTFMTTDGQVYAVNGTAKGRGILEFPGIGGDSVSVISVLPRIARD